MKRFVGAACAATIAVVCPMAPALAAADALPNTDRIAIDVSATLVERCGLSAGSNPAAAQARIDQAATLTFNFNIDCNTPFRIGVSSANGAMRLTTEPAGANRRAADGFAVEKSYRVGLAVGTDKGLLDGGLCESRELTGRDGGCAFWGDQPGRGLSSQNAVAIHSAGSVTVRWGAEDGEGARHAAGLYQDTLTVVVGPRL